MSFINEFQLSQYRQKTKTFSADNIVNLNESYSRDKISQWYFYLTNMMNFLFCKM